MKNRRIKTNTFRLFLIAACMIFYGCSVNWFGNLQEDIIDDTSTYYTFYSAAESSNQKALSFSQRYSIGQILNKSDLPQKSDERLANFKIGYEIIGWKIYQNSQTKDLKGLEFTQIDDVIYQITVTQEPADLLALYKPRSDTKYKVNYWTQNKERTSYTLYKSETFMGVTDTLTNAAPITIAGFENLPFTQTNISPDGSAVVDIYYDRLKIKITVSDAINPDTDYEGYFGQPVTDAGYVMPDRSSESYFIDRWTITYTAGGSTTQNGSELTFPEQDAVCTAVWKLKTVEGSGSISNPLGVDLSFELDKTKIPVGTSQIITVKAFINSNPVAAEYFNALLNPDYTITSYGAVQSGFTVGTEKNTITIPANYGYGNYEIIISGTYNGLGYSATCTFEIE